MLFSKRLTSAPTLVAPLKTTIQRQGVDFHAELIPVHSPLLRESRLVSFPALTYMLKFSAWSCLTSCLGVEGTNPPKRCGIHFDTHLLRRPQGRSTMLVCSDDSDILNASALIQH